MVVVKVVDTESTENLFDKASLKKISEGFMRDGWLSVNSVIHPDALSPAQQEIQGYISGIHSSGGTPSDFVYTSGGTPSL